MKYFNEEPICDIFIAIRINNRTYLLSKIGMLIIIVDTELQDLKSAYLW